MTSWTRIRLTEARQVLALIGTDPDEWPDAATPVRDHYVELRRNARTTQALEYLGHALPRAETLAWAAHLLEAESANVELTRPAQAALDTALRWIGEPSHRHRRAARAAAKAVRKPGPERLLAMAVFYSGGSVAPHGSPDVLPRNETCARYAVAAVQQAGYRSSDPAAFHARALKVAEAVAEHGLAALER